MPSPTEVLDQLDAALDDVASVGIDDVAGFAVQLQRRAARLQALVTKVVGAVDREGCIGSARDTAAWFAHRTRTPRPAARAMIANARALRHMPAVAAAFEDGAIGPEHVRVLASAQTCNPEIFEKFEDDLLDVAKVERFDRFKTHITYWRQLAAPDLVEDEAEAKYDARAVHASQSLDDHVYLDGILDPVGGAIFLTELRRLEQTLWEDDQRTGATRTNAQRRADALVLMAERSASCPADAVKPRVLLQVLVGYESFAGRICELADGTILTPGQVVSLLEDADIERVVFESPSKVLDVGHRQRLFKGATRTATQLAHLECQGDPSCDTRFDRCEIDHIQPFEWGGETTQFNGRPLCKWHHRKRQRSP